MRPTRFQHTLKHVAHVSGRGYWTGCTVTLTLLPAPADTGVVFRRVDLPGRPEVHAVATNRHETNLRTKLVHGDAHVEMVEHVMAALYGMEIDNCIVECDSAEMPGMDGSALAIAIAIETAGVKVQPVAKQAYVIETPVRVGNDEQWVIALPSSDSGLKLQYQLDYGPTSEIPKTTSSHLLSKEEFLQEIAPARTFLSEREAIALQSSGVASHVTYRELLVFGKDGPIDNSLRFIDECSRHKLLDLVGDLALCGVRVHGAIIAHKSGHVLNGRLAESILKLSKTSQNNALRRIA